MCLSPASCPPSMLLYATLFLSHHLVPDYPPILSSSAHPLCSCTRHRPPAPHAPGAGTSGQAASGCPMGHRLRPRGLRKGGMRGVEVDIGGSLPRHGRGQRVSHGSPPVSAWPAGRGHVCARQSRQGRWGSCMTRHGPRFGPDTSAGFSVIACRHPRSSQSMHRPRGPCLLARVRCDPGIAPALEYW